MSFLEKFKKNIGAEESEEKTTESKSKLKRKKKIKIKEPKKIEPEIEEKKEEKTTEALVETSKEKWFEKKGELAVDVYQTDDYLVIQSAVAGVEPENLDIFIENDILVIEGNREKPEGDENKNYYYQECYWGPFHRRIILQEEVDNSRVEATMKEGILTIKIPKIEKKKKRKVIVKETE